MNTISYKVTVTSKEDQALLFRCSGTRQESGIPTILLDQLGKRYGSCVVIYHNLTEGWYAEKHFE